MRKLAAAFAAILIAATPALCAPSHRWTRMRVDPLGKTVTLSAEHSKTRPISATTRPEMRDLLATLRGKWVNARVRESLGTVKVLELEAINESLGAISIVPATDDDAPIGKIVGKARFRALGIVRAEEEAGGNLYFIVPVRKGGEGGSPREGFVLSSSVQVVAR